MTNASQLGRRPSNSKGVASQGHDRHGKIPCYGPDRDGPVPGAYRCQMQAFPCDAVKDHVKRVQHPNSSHQDDGTNFLRHWHYVQLLTANENGLSATSKANGGLQSCGGEIEVMLAPASDTFCAFQMFQVRIPVGWPEARHAYIR